MKSNPAIDDKEMLVDAAQVRGPLLGGRSDMWIHRKLKDPESQFPAPIVIANRRYWRLGEIRAWIAAQAAKGKTRGPAAASAAILSMLLAGDLAPPVSPISAHSKLVVTQKCDPEIDFGTNPAAAPAFLVGGAAACGAVGRPLINVGREMVPLKKRAAVLEAAADAA